MQEHVVSNENGNNSDVGVVLITALAALFAIGAFGFMFGAFDEPQTWTASDMRGEVQRRLEHIDDRMEDEDVEWKRLKLQAERDELLAIVEPYE
jgi:hypothetical protein